MHCAVRRFGSDSDVTDGPVRYSATTQDQSHLRNVCLLLPARSSTVHSGELSTLFDPTPGRIGNIWAVMID